jgi:TrpR family trp operon transcriptional repressor
MNEEKLLKEGWRKFLKLIKQTNDLEELLRILLTKQEKAALAQRMLIVEALLKGEQTQREIAKYLHVSIAKITRGSNELKTINTRLRKFLEGEL